MESSYSLGGTVTAEAMMENSMEVPWNIKHRGIIGPCNPIPGLRSKENHHSKWQMHLDFQGSTIYNGPNIKPTKMSTDTNMETTLCICTLKYYSALKQNEIILLAAAWMNQEIIILCEVSQREKENILSYPVQVGSINSYHWTNVQNRNSLRKPNSDYPEKVRREG